MTFAARDLKADVGESGNSRKRLADLVEFNHDQRSQFFS